VTIQHCGNHGAMSTLPLVNNLLGLCNDLIGGASLMWRYHHQVRGVVAGQWPADVMVCRVSATARVQVVVLCRQAG
jgi:hypothetical protein